jgi:hypothetical protein
MTLSVSGFDRSLKHRIVVNDDCDETISTNVLGGPGVLKTVIIDNIQGNAINYVRCANGSSSTIANDTILASVPGAAGQKTTIEFPEGIPFDKALSFWCSSSANPAGTSAPSTTVNTGKITVTLVAC